MLKVKFFRNRKPIETLNEPISTQSKVSGHGLSTPDNSIGPAGDPFRGGSSQPRHAMESIYDPNDDKLGYEKGSVIEQEGCGCGCDSCKSGNHHQSKGNPDLDGDGIYAPSELYYHFDLDDDGVVTPEEYKDHVEWHEENPEVLEIDEETLFEKKDRCYRLAKQKYKVFPSAYASGAIVKCRQGKIWKKKNEAVELDESTFDKEKKSGLHGWFSRQGGKGKSKGWVDCRTCRTNPDTGRKTCKTCGRQSGEKRSGYPACRPTPSACTKAGTSKKKSSMRVSWKKKKEE
jgi:hypothetical protein